MKSIVDFTSDVFSIMRGNYTMFPRFTLMRMVAKERRDERIEKHIDEEMKKIAEAEKKGSISELKKETSKFVKDIHKEEKIDDFEVEGEEKIQRHMLQDVGTLIQEFKGSETLKNDKELREKVAGILKQLKEFTELQFNDLEQTKKGGRPWETTTMQLDIGECSNTVITSARDMRQEFGRINSDVRAAINMASKIDNLKEEDKKKEKEKIGKKLDDADKKLRKFLKDMKLNFHMTLRLFNFLVGELQKEDEHIKQMEQEGLPEKTSKELHKELHKALDDYHEKVEEESEFAQKIFQIEEREAAQL